jgi:hypothetical protein
MNACVEVKGGGVISLYNVRLRIYENVNENINASFLKLSTNHLHDKNGNSLGVF